MKTKKRFFGILLSLVLVLGLMPGMSLTAYAATAYTSGQIKIASLANGDIIRGTCTIYQNSNRALEIYDTDGTTLLQKYNFGKAQTLSALGYDTIVTKTGVGSGGYDNRLVKLQKLSPSPTVTRVTLDKNELSLDAGGATAELIATVEANYDAIKGVTWSSSDSTVATVNSNGVITPVGAGDPVTIKATSTWDNTKYAECVVTVNAAQTPTETLLTTITPTGKTTHSATVDGVVTVSHNNDSYYGTYGWLWMENADTLTVSACEGYTITKCIFKQNAKNPVTDSSAPFELHFDSVGQWGGVQCRENSEFDGVTSIEVYGYATPTATHSVTITPGDNMTKTDASGATSQSDLSGAMTDVVYTADDGYYFPTDYGVATVNGISVTWDSYTQITVSGTPTADATITLTAPTAKTTPAAPTTAGAVDCTTSDNNDGKLTGVTADMEYRKSDATEWTAGTGSDITGLVPGTYYVRVKATDTTLASDNQELTIMGFISYTVTFKVVNGSWNEGEGDAATTDKTVTLTGHDGDTLKLAANQIPAVGTKPNDTYKAGSWDVTPSTDTEITAATTYTYTYAQKDSISQTVTFKVVNGSWDDETTADKTVTLTGYEGDTLKLAATDIPAVGTKPNDTYKAGSWDVTPSAEMEITADTTYTYTYAQKDSISQTVTFKVVNGKWDDDSTEDKTVTLTGYEGDTLKLTADQIPAVGTKPDETYKAGSWDTTPSTDTEITAATTYTYTYAAKEASVVTKAPEAKTLTYNGSAQELVTAGTATGGEMQYALGTATEATQPYTTSIPTATEAGIYYVWYKVIGDENHSDFTADKAVLVEIKADTTAPTGEISIDTNKWTSFLSTITFGLFFKETKEVTITAEDDLTGVQRIEYYVSDQAISLEQVKAVTEWKTYESTFKLNPEKKYVVYARLTDKAGNITYISSNGLVFVNLPVGYVTDITENSATLNMQLSAAVQSEVRTAGFEYKKKADADMAWTKVEGDFASGTFTKKLTSLTAGTDYVFRPYVTYTNDSTDTGADQNFTTDTKPAVTGSIDVKVKNDTEEKKDVVVTIEEGNYALASQEKDGISAGGEVTTGKFKELPDGTYNIVIKSKDGEFVETKMITIANGAAETISFTISKGEMKTDVEVEADTPKVAVDGLSKEELVQSGTITSDEKTKVESGEISVEVTLKAEKQEQGKVKTETVSAIQQVMAESSTKLVVDMFLDLSLFKTVTQLTGDQAGETAKTDVGSTNTKVLEIAVPYDTTIKGLMVYRYHGSAASALKKLSSAPAKGAAYEDGSFYLSGKYIHIFASGFSTYAIAKEESSSGGGGGTTPATPGKTTPSKPAAPTLDSKTDTSITVKTVAGQEYSIDGGKTWQTSGTFTGLAPETEYSIVTKITATGTANESPVSDELKVTTDKKADPSAPTPGSTTTPTDKPTETSGSTTAPTDTPSTTTTPGATDTPSTTTTPGATSAPADKVTKTEKAKAKLLLNVGLKVSYVGKKVTVKWGKVSKADRYVVYAAYCGPDKCTKIKTLSGSKASMTFTKLNGSKLNLKKNIKVYVVAYRKVNGKETKLARSITAHVVGTKNAKYTNVKKIKLSKSSYTLKVNKTATVKAEIVLEDKKKKQLSDGHAPEFRYASSNTKVATVDKNGKIKAVGKGTCYIYVYAKNGYAKKIKVVVK